MYNEKQRVEIKERVEKARVLLKELKLSPAAQVSKENLGNDQFVDKVVCYLQDTRYVKQGDEYIEFVPAEPVGIPTE